MLRYFKKDQNNKRKHVDINEPNETSKKLKAKEYEASRKREWQQHWCVGREWLEQDEATGMWCGPCKQYWKEKKVHKLKEHSKSMVDRNNQLQN